MIIGKYIRDLLEDRNRVILPGFGNLKVIPSAGTKAKPGERLNPPGLSVKFDTGFTKDDGLLAEAMAAGEVIEREEAKQKVLELVDAIKFSLDKGEDFLLKETGSFSRDADGKIHFHADPAWVLEPEQYGLESMELLELEELPDENGESQKSEKKSKASPEVTVLAPPRPKPKSNKWRVIWLVAAALIVVLVVLIMVPTGEREDGESKGLFNRKADRDQLEQVEDPAGQEEVSEEEPDVQGELEEVPVTDQDMDAESGAGDLEEEEEEVQQVEESKNFFIIAGSFSKLKNASDLQDELNNRGYNAEVMITENRMYRVSVASFASKEEAESTLAQIKTEPGLQSSWLLSN